LRFGVGDRRAGAALVIVIGSWKNRGHGSWCDVLIRRSGGGLAGIGAGGPR
jgi:hypothetical protein